MPAAVGSRKPPAKHCPLCQAKIWDPDTTRSTNEAWRLYREHIHTTHPTYQKWERKISMLYLIVAAVFVSGLFGVIFVPASLSVTVFATAVGVLLIGTPVVSLVKWNGTRNFKVSWKREHAASTVL